MAEALLALLSRDDDWGQQRSNRYDEVFYRSYTPRSYRWKSSPECGRKWKDQSEIALEAGPSLEDRPREEVFNTTIDKIYDELAELVALRSDQPNEKLEKTISGLFRRLRELQQQEGDRIRKVAQSQLSGSITAGLDILEHLDEIRARYAGVTAANKSTQDSNTPET